MKKVAKRTQATVWATNKLALAAADIYNDCHGSEDHEYEITRALGGGFTVSVSVAGFRGDRGWLSREYGYPS